MYMLLADAIFPKEIAGKSKSNVNETWDNFHIGKLSPGLYCMFVNEYSEYFNSGYPIIQVFVFIHFKQIVNWRCRINLP